MSTEPFQPAFAGLNSEGKNIVKIEVIGNSTISRRAERAVLHVRVESFDHDQVEVSTNVTQTANVLQGLLEDLSPRDTTTGRPTHNAAVTHWSMSTLTIDSYFSRADGKTNPLRTYTTHTSFEAKFADFARLGAVATQMSALPCVSISHIDWRLTDVTRASFATQSRRKAVLDAVEQAKDFAAAVGKGEVRPVSISDWRGYRMATFGSRGRGRS